MAVIRGDESVGRGFSKPLYPDDLLLHVKNTLGRKMCHPVPHGAQKEELALRKRTEKA